MKNINKIALIILITMILFPNNVFAKEEKPELKWEKEDIKTDVNYTGTKILCGTGNGYIAVDSNGEIAQYNADGDKVNVITVTSDEIFSAIIDGDNLVFISVNEKDYLIYLNKYTLDGNLIYQKDITIYNGINIVNGNDGYYIYSDSNIFKFDKDGNYINLIESGSVDDLVYDKNKNEIIVLFDVSSIGVLDENLENLELKENILSNPYDKIKIVDDGYILWLEGSNNALAKLNKNFEIVWEINNLSIIINDIEEVEDGYILVGSDPIVASNRKTPKLVKINADGNVLYEETYDKYTQADFDKIITLNNNDYIIHTQVGGNVYAQYSGSVILKYGYKDYNITTNIKGGGVIDSTLDTAKEGDKVTFNATPKDGYELKSIKVVTVSGKVIEVTDNSFIMPDEDVIIEGEFVRTLIENPKTGNIIMIIIGIGVILILGTITTIYYKIKKDRT